MKSAEEIGRATLERFAIQRARRQGEAAALRDEVERLLVMDAGPHRGRARRILSSLRVQQPASGGELGRLSLRTIQRHLHAISARLPQT